jgi:glycosyltransferase involved in cell wall biosynthesis
MKILLINNFHYLKGGSETIYFETANILKENGHKVLFFSQKDNNVIDCEQLSYFIDRKVEVAGSLFKKICFFKDYFYNKQAVRNLDLLLAKERPDIAHIHLFVGGMTSSIFPVLKKYNIPVVHTTHDYRLICPAYLYLNGKGDICESCKKKNYFMCVLNKCNKKGFLLSIVMCLEMYYRNILYNPIKMIDGFIFPSNFSKDKHLQYIPRILEKTISVIYHPVEVNNQISKEKGSYCLYYGRLSSEKGILTLLKAMKILSGVTLKIAGKGPQFPLLQDYVDRYNLKNIEFLGFKQGKELIELISKAYFVIVPSECYEVFGLVIAESQSVGTPIIGARIGGIPEIIENGKTGYLFNPGDIQDLVEKIKLVLSLSVEEYLNISMNTYNFAKEYYNKNIYYNNIMNIYKSVIKNRKR